MPGLSMKGKQPLAELLVELIKQLEKTNRQIEALAGQNYGLSFCPSGKAFLAQ